MPKHQFQVFYNLEEYDATPGEFGLVGDNLTLRQALTQVKQTLSPYSQYNYTGTPTRHQVSVHNKLDRFQLHRESRTLVRPQSLSDASWRRVCRFLTGEQK